MALQRSSWNEHCLHSAKTLHFMMDYIFFIGFSIGEHAGQSISLDPFVFRHVRAHYLAYIPYVAVRLEAFVAPMAQSWLTETYSSFHC